MCAFINYSWDKMSDLKLLSAWGTKGIKVYPLTLRSTEIVLLILLLNLCLRPSEIYFMFPELNRIGIDILI